MERDCATASDYCYKHSPGYWQCRPLDIPLPLVEEELLSDAEAAAARGKGAEGELDAAQERPVDTEGGAVQVEGGVAAKPEDGFTVQAEGGISAQRASSADSARAAGAFWAAMAASLALGMAIGALAAPAWRMCHSAAPTRKPAAVTVKNEQQYMPSQPSI